MDEQATHNDTCAGCGSPADAERLRRDVGRSVAGSIAAQILADNFNAGKPIEIPSLGITLRKKLVADSLAEAASDGS